MEPTGDSPTAADRARGAAVPGDCAHAEGGVESLAGPRPDDAQQLHGSRVATGLTPLVWATVVVVVVLIVLVWQLS